MTEPNEMTTEDLIAEGLYAIKVSRGADHDGKILRALCDRLEAETAARVEAERRLAIAIEALQDIENPMVKIDREYKPLGFVYVGMLLCQDLNYYKSLARQALERIQPVAAPASLTCPACDGEEFTTCPECDGTGDHEGPGGGLCPACEGEGRHRCDACEGTGIQEAPHG